MFVSVTTVRGNQMLINSSFIATICFDADPEHRTIITSKSGEVLTVADRYEAFSKLLEIEDDKQ